MSRRPSRTTFALAAAVVVFVAFGMARVAAPVGVLGVVFQDPAAFAVVAAITSLAGALLLFVRPVQMAVARWLGGASRPPTAGEAERLGRLLAGPGERSGLDPGALIVRIQDDPGANAGAGAANLLFVTSGALALPDESLQAVLAHELGHHHGLHPVLAAIVWWLRLPGAALGAVYRFLRRLVVATGTRVGTLGRLLAVPVALLLVVWQVAVMWLFWIGELLAMRAARVSEYDADAAAARWGYGEPLARALEGLAGSDAAPERLLDRLMAEHPPLEDRLERLRAA